MPDLWRLPDRDLYIGRRPLVMGIVNVTPDSFSDGGQHFDPGQAVAHGLKLVADGADVLDVGGESTRPGAAPVPLEEELRRVVPVVRELARATSAPISIDTSKAEVARQALAAGAKIVNDVTAFTGDAEMLPVARSFRAGVVLMHMQGTPRTMQQDPTYRDVVAEVRDYLQERLATLVSGGIEPDQVTLDPGIGFGKRQGHNLALLAHLGRLRELGRPVVLGVSRKGFINKVLGRAGWVEHGDAGTVGVLLQALSRGHVQVARVHNVQAVADAMRMFIAVEAAREESVPLP
jgi:dihydropteroate synthase